MRECELTRHAAYFRGWCQAFGEHESIEVVEKESYWLLAEKQVGLVLPRTMIRPLYREVLLHEQIPELRFNPVGVHIGSLHFPFRKNRERTVLEAMQQLVADSQELHLFLTSHLLYGGGNRIITWSSKRPITIIYKEIGSMHLTLD